MIYGTVEILIFAALLQSLHFYPEERWWVVPALAINAIAILLSLTRMLWICSLLLVAIHLAWRRSHWIRAVPAAPFLALLLAPGIVRLRVSQSIHSDYYSNSERVQMLKVGWEMIRKHPITGVGAGRVEELYTTYLSPADPVPAYHGHLHNNLMQLAAEFGLPVAAAAIVFVAALFCDLVKQYKRTSERDRLFLSSTALLGLTGWLVSGLFDYTYGHSLGLILLCFVVLTPLVPNSQSVTEVAGDRAANAAPRDFVHRNFAYRNFACRNFAYRNFAHRK